jgi:hypothetical protein
MPNPSPANTKGRYTGCLEQIKRPIPLKRGLIFHIDNGLSDENWPRESSMKKRGMPHRKLKRK